MKQGCPNSLLFKLVAELRAIFLKKKNKSPDIEPLHVLSNDLTITQQAGGTTISLKSAELIPLIINKEASSAVMRLVYRTIVIINELR